MDVGISHLSILRSDDTGGGAAHFDGEALEILGLPDRELDVEFALLGNGYFLTSCGMVVDGLIAAICLHDLRVPGQRKGEGPPGGDRAF